MPREWLEGSPFEDYFIPGLVLFVVVGGSLLAAAIFVFAGLHLARLVAIATGMVVLGWLVVETLIIGYVSWMQPATTIGALEAMARAYTEGDEDRSAEDAVESYVGAFLDFLGHDPNFVRLIQREALEDGSRVAEFFGLSVDDAVAALGPAAEKAGISPERLLLDLAALCWYPFAHEHTLLPALGINARDPAFLDEQKRHLGDLVRAMTRPEPERRSRRQRS